jgi:hypothetical protein
MHDPHRVALSRRHVGIDGDHLLARCSGLLIVIGVGMFAVKRVRRQRAR